jgi:hypothetical protein
MAGRKGRAIKITLAIEALLDNEALTQKAIDLAKEGDLQALRLCLDRLVPPRKDRPVSFELPAITCAGDAAKASAALVLRSLKQPTWKNAEEAGEGHFAMSRITGIEKLETRRRLTKPRLRRSGQVMAPILPPVVHSPVGRYVGSGLFHLS